jgi:hypothetical protein
MTSPQFSRTPWRKSSYSGSSGQECVEVAAVWRKSSHSGGGGSECVEVARLSRDRTLVRDSKNPDGPMLSFTPAEWAAFLGGAKTGAFDLTH